jgi:hypothetical protein
MAFTEMTSDKGIIYAIRESGEPLWSCDELRNGTNGAAGVTH